MPRETIGAWRVRLTGPPALWLAVLGNAAANFFGNRAPQMAASLAYFALLSVFPFVLLVFAIGGLVLRDDERRRRVLSEVVEALPVEAPAVEEALHNLAQGGASMGLIALVVTVIAATALARSLRGSLNVVFGARRQQPLLLGWLVDLTVLPVLGLLFLASLALSAVWRLTQALAREAGLFADSALLWEAGALAIPALLSFTGLLLLYRLIPNRELHTRDLWPGALIAALGFHAGTSIFAVYFENFGAYDVVYGSLAGIIALLAWVYVSSLILLFGAEVAAETSRRARLAASGRGAGGE